MPGCQSYKERCKLSNQYQICEMYFRLTLAFIFRLFIYVLIVTFL